MYSASVLNLATVLRFCYSMNPKSAEETYNNYIWSDQILIVSPICIRANERIIGSVSSHIYQSITSSGLGHIEESRLIYNPSRHSEKATLWHTYVGKG
ncbi:hypothetical protein AMTR_s00037p00041490 [Amborella trichopoda]|uniref:Uncharacterized protein n=1 Tax=Amborella trichopoda TaxID=13333 RepID=U5CVE5_AMBTC|nr:hypothetical protein AMTR_s00037p00041490 [Amborella trichopoda]